MMSTSSRIASTNPAGQATPTKPVSFTPELCAVDPLANYWLSQATVRLRREICWAWRERTGAPAPPGDPHAVPPRVDRVSGALDLTRYADAKRAFFEADPTTGYLSQQLCLPKPRLDGAPPQGSFGWVVSTLRLDDCAAFTLALVLAAAADHAMGPVIGACQNDPNQSYPTLALAQKLWDWPAEAIAMADPAHPLRRCGLLTDGRAPGQAEPSAAWDAPLVVLPMLTQRLLFPGSLLPETLREIEPPGDEEALPDSAKVVVARLRAAGSSSLRVAPIRGSRGSPRAETARAIGAACGMKVVEWRGGAALLAAGELRPAATLCWLNGHALYILASTHERAGERSALDGLLAPLHSLPITLLLGIEARGDLGSLPEEVLLPTVEVPKLTYSERVAEWRSALGPAAGDRDGEIAECSRRFRYEKQTIRAIAGALAQADLPLDGDELLAACRAELPQDMGELAQAVSPRFETEELVLPYAQRLQFEEIFQAMSALTTVHYGWGAAKAWNEGGISVLFAGPSGTGKTMAAEVLAARLKLPMYRIDLSQVVNKYIGETEKNLKKLFDAADISDTLLLFDEADALFGRRSEVKDAHDRYANLEISYLLERMERFKGLAILATNRKKDLDEAFLRRLRYTVDFPLPEPEQRRQIWMRAVPEGADGSGLDFDFLAQQFQLTGGHIKSVVFNACLQTAGARGNGLTMETVLLAIKREYDKLNRSVSLDAFGKYADVVEKMARG